MSSSTRGQLYYGVVLKDGFETPWYDDFIEEWWIHEVHKFPQANRFFDESGHRIPGMDEEWRIYVNSFDEFKYAHPCPIEIIHMGNYDYPLSMLAVVNRGWTSYRRFPVRIEPSDMVHTDGDYQILMSFCEKYGIKYNGEPAWYLSSFWG
jgi:hypothetical protein